MSVLPRTADFVVIGGGSIGTAIAYHLARRQAGRVVLFERDSIASGSTGRAAGLISQQFGDDFHLPLARESVEFFEHLAAERRFGLVFRQTGYVNLLFHREDVEWARRVQPLQRRYGVEVDILSPGAAAERVPGLNVADVAGATDCARDGYTDPHLATNAIAELAREAGAHLFVGTEVTGLEVTKGRVAAVRTAAGTVATRMAIDAAGPWAALVSRLAGVDIPVRPFRRQLWFTQACDFVRSDAPVLFDGEHDFYFRREGDGVVMCLGNPEEEMSFTTDVEWSFAEKVAAYATHRFPAFEEARLVSAWAAPRDITPDHDAILGPLPGIEGLVVAAGHSGHGFMLAPAVGRMMADYLVDGASQPSIFRLGYDRFAGREFGAGAFRPTGT